MSNITIQDKWQFQMDWIKKNVKKCPKCGKPLYVEVNWRSKYDEKRLLVLDDKGNVVRDYTRAPFADIACKNICTECDGTGYITRDLYNEHECENCEDGYINGCGWRVDGDIVYVISQLFPEGEEDNAS